MNYTFTYEGQITVTAESKDEAREIAEDLIAPTMYAYDNSVDVSLYELELIDTYEE